MGATRRLPEDAQRRLDRLDRDNWRTQVATAPVIGAEGEDDASAGDDASDGDVVPLSVPGEAVSWAEVVDRLTALEERMTNLEGVETSG